MIETKQFWEDLAQETRNWRLRAHMTPWISYMRQVEKRVFFEHLEPGNVLDIGSGRAAQSIMLAGAGRAMVSFDISRNMSLRLLKNRRMHACRDLLRQ